MTTPCPDCGGYGEKHRQGWAGPALVCPTCKGEGSISAPLSALRDSQSAIRFHEFELLMRFGLERMEKESTWLDR